MRCSSISVEQSEPGAGSILHGKDSKIARKDGHGPNRKPSNKKVGLVVMREVPVGRTQRHRVSTGVRLTNRLQVGSKGLGLNKRARASA